MKKFNKKSLAVVGLALSLSAAALTGCGTDELEAKVDENASNAEVAVNDAATKAADDLAAAKSALEAAIQSGDTANTEALTKAISDLNAAIDAAKQAATTGDETLDAAIKAAEKTTNEAMKALEEDLTAKYTALKTAMESTTATKEELNAKANELIQAMTAASGLADETIKALKAELTTKIEAVQNDLSKKCEDLQAALDALKTGAATKDELAAKATELSGQITNLRTDIEAVKAAYAAADESINGTITTLAANLQGLSDKVNGLSGDLNEVLNEKLKEYISKNEWNATTELLIPIVNELGTAKAEALVNAGSAAKLAAKVETTYTEAYVRIIRALDEQAAKDALADAKEVFDGVKKLADTYAPYEDAIEDGKYDEEGKKALEDAYDEAIDRFTKLNTEEGADDTVEKIVEDLKKALAAVLPEDLAAAAEQLAQDIAALREQLKADGEYAYNNDNLTEYNRIETVLAELLRNPEIAGTVMDVVNKKANETDEKGQYDLLQDEWAAAKKVFDDAVAELLGELDAANANGSKFLYNDANWQAINQLNDKVSTFLAQQLTTRGFTENTEGVAIFKAIRTFRTGVFKRAKALNTAYEQALIINDAIEDFAEDVENVGRIDAYYPQTMRMIEQMVADWNAAYFSAPYDDETVKDEANKYYANYELLDHEAYDALVASYAEKIQKFIDAVDDAAKAIVAVGDPSKLTLLDYDKVDAAQKVFDKTWNLLKLGEIEIALDSTEYAKDHYLSFEEMRAAMEALHNRMAQLLENAADAYDSLALLNGEMVTVYSKPEVDALAGWFKTYLGVDITADDATWPLGEDAYVFSETCTVDEDAFEKACSIYDDYKTLVDAKTALEKTITDKIEALFNDHDGKACTSQRILIGEIQLLCNNWLSGAYGPVLELVDIATAVAEEGSSTTTTPVAEPRFVAAQLKADPAREAEIMALIADVEDRDVEVKALEDRRDAICARVEALKDYDLTTVAGRNAAKAEIDSIREAIAELIEDNAGHDCFTGRYECYTALAQAEFALYYGEAMEQIAKVTDAKIKGDLTKRANELKKAVDAAIKENVKVDLTVDIERMALIAYTAEQCVAVQGSTEGLYGKYMVVAAEMEITADDYKIGEDGKVDMESLNKIVSYKKNNIKLTINP